MEIVVTNDDGWGTKGILTLVMEMCKLGHVTVVAPDSARSGHGACISVTKELRINKIEDSDVEQTFEQLFAETGVSDSARREILRNTDVYTSNGTPADCVKLALEILFAGRRVDLLASGINHGNNCSVNLVYSGTMGACFVGTEHRVPAIGFSLDDHAMDADFQLFREHIVPITQMLLQRGFDRTECINVNAPTGEIKGVKWTRQCAGHWEKEFITHEDACGTFYTMTGQYVNEEPEAEDTDMWAIGHGYISIQAVNIDMTSPHRAE